MISSDCLLRPHGQHYHEFGEEYREKDSTMILFIKDMNYELHELIMAEKKQEINRVLLKQKTQLEIMKPLFISPSSELIGESIYAMASRWERIGAWLKKVENQKNLARFTRLDIQSSGHAIGHWKDIGLRCRQYPPTKWTLTEMIWRIGKHTNAIDLKYLEVYYMLNHNCEHHHKTITNHYTRTSPKQQPHGGSQRTWKTWTCIPVT